MTAMSLGHNIPSSGYGTSAISQSKQSRQSETFSKNEKAASVREQNICAAKSIADTVRTSLGPRGMDKMIKDAKGAVVISNDGATIMNEMNVTQPAAKMLVELSKAQDIEAGDGTTSVVVFAGSLLSVSQELLEKGIHSQAITRGFILAAEEAVKVLDGMAIPVNLTDKQQLVKAATTSFNSKVVSQLSYHLAPVAVDAVLSVLDDPATATNVDLRDIRIVSVVGGTLEDTQTVDGLVLSHQRVSRQAGGPLRIANAKIGLIQFCLSLPKTDIESQITVKDYESMDRLLRQERLHYAKMVKQIAATGCNVLLIQKSILRDSVTDIALSFLSKANILVIRDIERDDIEFISKSLNCDPVASLDHFTTDRLGSAALVCEEIIGSNRIVKFTGVKPTHKTCTVLLRAGHQLTLDEAERSFHDALCVIRSLVKARGLIAGGGAAEAEMSVRLEQKAMELSGVDHLCMKAFAEALEVIPYTLAENAGTSPLELLGELKKCHAEGNKNAGVDVKKGRVNIDMMGDVIQPLLVTRSMIKLATETACMILKIDDVVLTR